MPTVNYLTDNLMDGAVYLTVIAYIGFMVIGCVFGLMVALRGKK